MRSGDTLPSEVCLRALRLDVEATSRLRDLAQSPIAGQWSTRYPLKAALCRILGLAFSQSTDRRQACMGDG